ncbi:MAG TPA: ABC transporter ATP-binding protein [Candidatus Dormibacteraeota bacterium]|nr:ABC transporter ATP-binding protein [Candidatus Dormibacteraeota bacterium]
MSLAALSRGEPAIDVADLRRTYRTTTGTLRRRRLEIEAVRGISLRVEPGELFGLLGPNGAGKTTTIRVLCTLLLPTSGTVRVLGMDVVDHPREVRRQIGYVFGGDRGLYDRLSAFDNLRYFADLYALEPRLQRRRIAEVLELVGLQGRDKERVEGFSRGMRQRLHLARGLLHDPPVLFFDEPTIGVDPVGAREVRQLVHELAQAGKTILLTTHYMFEADSLCDRIAVISKGKIVAQGTPVQLKAGVTARTVVEIEAYGVPELTVQRIRELQDVENVTTEIREQAQLLTVQAREGSQLTGRLLQLLEGVRVERIVAREPTLEDAYVALVTAP